MAIDVDWTGTSGNPYRIFVPRADMTILQASPEIRELDVDTFRLMLKDLEAAVEGMMWPDTHQHTTETQLSGFTYARFVKILAPYSVEFEDGQYVVATPGANHNIADVKVQNQVGIVTQNSGGLLVTAAVESAADIATAVWSEDMTGGGGFGTQSAGWLLVRMRKVVAALLGNL